MRERDDPDGARPAMNAPRSLRRAIVLVGDAADFAHDLARRHVVVPRAPLDRVAPLFEKPDVIVLGETALDALPFEWMRETVDGSPATVLAVPLSLDHVRTQWLVKAEIAEIVHPTNLGRRLDELAAAPLRPWVEPERWLPGAQPSARGIHALNVLAIVMPINTREWAALLSPGDDRTDQQRREELERLCGREFARSAADVCDRYLYVTTCALRGKRWPLAAVAIVVGYENAGNICRGFRRRGWRVPREGAPACLDGDCLIGADCLTRAHPQ